MDFAILADPKVKKKTTEKMKRETSTKTLPENQENCGTWGWWWYLLQLGHLEVSEKALRLSWESLESEDE